MSSSGLPTLPESAGFWPAANGRDFAKHWAVDSPKEDSGLIDIFAMQQKAADERAEVLAAQKLQPIVAAPLSEVPPAVTRDTNADLAEFATAAMGTSWTKKVRPSWIAGGVGAMIAIIALVSLTGGSDDKKTAAATPAVTAPAAPPPPAPPPVAIAPAPAPVAAAAPEPAKEVAKKPTSKKHAKAKKSGGSKLQKVSSSGT
jgi:hypothetical protein